MAKEFSEKVVLITGASSGIGASTAVYFSKLGATLALTGRNIENLQKIGQQCTIEGNPKPLLIKADLTNENDVKRIMNTTIEHFKKLDILINNAGIFELCSIEDGNLQHYDKIMNTNLRAVYQLTTLATPHLIATKGNIVNVSSLAGVRAFPNVTTYCMSKAALDQFTKCISLELAPKGVRVNSVNPGVTVTDIFARQGMTQKEIDEFLKHHCEINPLGRVGKAEEVAGIIAFLTSEKASFLTGVIVPVDGGRGNVCPR